MNDHATTGESDAELLALYADKQDQSAFGELYRRYSGLVHSVCQRHLGSSSDAEDAATACFLVLARKAGAIDAGHLAGWLCWCAKRLTANLARKNARRMAREEALRRTNAMDADATNENALQEVLCAVETEIASLPVRQRSAIVAQRLMCRLPKNDYSRGLSVACALEFIPGITCCQSENRRISNPPSFVASLRNFGEARKEYRILK